jgi:hypothetical protein
MARNTVTAAAAEKTVKNAAPGVVKVRKPKARDDFGGRKSSTGGGRPPKYTPEQIGHMVELVRDHSALKAMKILRADAKARKTLGRYAKSEEAAKAERKLAKLRDLTLFPEPVGVCWMTLKRWIQRAAKPVILAAGPGGHTRLVAESEVA